MKMHNRFARRALSLSLALGLLAGAGQAFAADPPTKASKMESEEPVTDTWITTKVKSDLLATKDVSGTDIKVETSNGLVSLSGSVATQAEHDKAVEVAKAIKGVKKVDAMHLKVGAHAGH